MLHRSSGSGIVRQYRNMEKIMQTLYVSEIFSSIDGEGIYTGNPATFIRLSGCNLKCRFCDTGYASQLHCGEEMELNDIINSACNYKNKRITLTGGEPLLQPHSLSLIKELTNRGFLVNIETNGSLPVDEILALPNADNITITMDYKSSSSLCGNSNPEKYICQLRTKDVLKFVLIESDFEECFSILRDNKINAIIFLSPVYGECDPLALVEFAKSISTRLPEYSERVRFQLQLHKILWNPNKRGV